MNKHAGKALRRLQDANTNHLSDNSAGSLCRALALPEEPDLAPEAGFVLRLVLMPSFHAESVVDVMRRDGSWSYSIRSARIQLFQFARIGTLPENIADRLAKKLLPPGVWLHQAPLHEAPPASFRSLHAIRAGWNMTPAIQLDGIGISLIVREGEEVAEFQHPSRAALATSQTQALLGELVRCVIRSCADPDALDVLEAAVSYLA